jgi:hypothetical protein
MNEIYMYDELKTNYKGYSIELGCYCLKNNNILAIITDKYGVYLNTITIDESYEKDSYSEILCLAENFINENIKTIHKNQLKLFTHEYFEREKNVWY